MILRTLNIILCLFTFSILLTCTKFEDNHTTKCFPPYIDFRVTVDSATQIVKIDSVIKINGPFNKFSWNFGNGVSSTRDIPQPFKYSNKTIDTTYNIALTVSNDCQEISTWYKPVFVSGCLVEAVFDTISINKTFATFINKSKPGIKKVKYTWDFGDGTPKIVSSSSMVEHQYTIQANYTVRLTASSDCGDNSTQKTVSIGCYKNFICNDCIHKVEYAWNKFSFNIENPIGIKSIKWDFGDGSAPFIGFSTPQHTYSENIYIITATVTNECNETQAPIPFTVVVKKPEDEYNESKDISGFSQSDNYHQVAFLNNYFYILKSNGYFYKFNLTTKGISNEGLSPGTINSRNKLKRDNLNTTLFNFGDFGLYYWDNVWRFVDGTKNITDIDCNFTDHVYTGPTSTGIVHNSIVYNPLSQYFFVLIMNNNNLSYFKFGENDYSINESIKYINNSCHSLTIDMKTYKMFFISPDGIVMTDPYGRFLKLIDYSNFPASIVGAKKILVDNHSILFLLSTNGSLLKYNISTAEYYPTVWPSGINDFDIFSNANSSETDIVIAGNGLLKHLIKN